MNNIFYKFDKGLIYSPYNLTKDYEVVQTKDYPVTLDLVCTIDLSQINESIAYLIRISSYIYPEWEHPYKNYKSGFSLQSLKNLHFTSKSKLPFEDWIVNESLDIDLYLVSNFQEFIKYSTKINFIN